MHPDLTPQDIGYVTATFQTQTDSDRDATAAGLAPQPCYVLPDGRAMVCAAPDPDLALAADRGDLRRRFLARWIAAGGYEQDADPELTAWLNGGYGVCLRTPAPESILAKSGLAQAITALIARPMPEQDWWRAGRLHRCAHLTGSVWPRLSPAAVADAAVGNCVLVNDYQQDRQADRRSARCRRSMKGAGPDAGRTRCSVAGGWC